MYLTHPHQGQEPNKQSVYLPSFQSNKKTNHDGVCKLRKAYITSALASTLFNHCDRTTAAGLEVQFGLLALHAADDDVAGILGNDFVVVKHGEF